MNELNLTTLDSEPFYRQLFDWAGEGILVINESGNIILANHRLRSLFGYSQEELIGQSLKMLLPKPKQTAHSEHVKIYFKHPHARRMSEKANLKGLKKNGQEFFVDISLNHFKIQETTYAVALVTDITDRVISDRKIQELNESLEEKVQSRTKDLEESQILYRTIARNFPEGTINVFDKNLNYVFAEGKELFKLGIESDQLIGSSFIERLPDEFKEEVSVTLTEVFKGKSEGIELNKGNEFYSLDAVPLYNSNNEITRILVVEKNISKAKKIEREIKRSLEKEKELNSLKSRFVSMASHEFRTPLSTILSSIQLISKYTTSDQQEQRSKHIKRVISSVGHLNNVLNDFLSLEKLESGKVHTKLSEFHLLTICKDLKEDLSSNLKKDQNIAFSFTAENEQIYFDENALKTILINLLSNAIKYSSEGSSIYMNVALINDLLTISIKDEGVGIPEEEQVYLFDRFFRAKNVSNIEGTGLGLNIVKSYVDILNGSINFTSELNVGSTFTLTFPIDKKP